MATVKLLLVDDSATCIAFERVLLQSVASQIVTAADGEAALAAAREHKPDLVLMDVMLPGMTGIECCRFFRADSALREIPIIVVTTKDEQSVVSEAFAAGCTDFITKPIDKGELLRKIRGHLEARN